MLQHSQTEVAMPGLETWFITGNNVLFQMVFVQVGTGEKTVDSPDGKTVLLWPAYSRLIHACATAE